MRAKPLILIVDDEKDFREIITAELAAAGLDVVAAENGDMGIKKAAELLPDLILMDINMPGMTGTEAALTIKQADATKDIKISFLTNADDPFPGLEGEHAAVTKELGVDAFLKKTDDPKQFVEKVQTLLAGISASEIPTPPTDASAAPPVPETEEQEPKNPA